MKTPYFAMGNDELAKMPALKDEVLCIRCGKMHKVQFPKEILKDGTKVESKTLAFVECRGKSFLVGIKGKDITLRFRKQ